MVSSSNSGSGEWGAASVEIVKKLWLASNILFLHYHGSITICDVYLEITLYGIFPKTCGQ